MCGGYGSATHVQWAWTESSVWAYGAADVRGSEVTAAAEERRQPLTCCLVMRTLAPVQKQDQDQEQR